MQTARDILAAKGKKLGPGAWLVLGKKTGFSLRASMIALEKLMTFVGEKVMIEAEDVEAVIGITKEETVFHLTAAMMEKNLPKSLSTLKDLLDQGDHPLMILAILAREIRLLLHAKLLLSSGQLASYHPKMDYNRFQKTVYPDIKHLGGSSTPHPYVIYQALIHTPHFSQERLVEYLDTLVDIDLALKTTSKAPRLMMERFLLQVCSS
jgi:DNA polymerase-3 subunit delta